MAKILIIEDDAFLADDLKFFIEEKGHTCQIYFEADDVIDNLEKLDEFEWIILDIMMLKGEKMPDNEPEVDTGEILYRMIRAKYPKKKFLILSAKDFKDMTVDFANEPYVQTMLKPVNENNLKQLVAIVSGESTS